MPWTKLNDKLNDDAVSAHRSMVLDLVSNVSRFSAVPPLLQHAIDGIASEAGEIAAIARMCPTDESFHDYCAEGPHVEEELGDILFYAQLACIAMMTTPQSVNDWDGEAPRLERFAPRIAMFNLMVAAGELTDHKKKVIYQKHDLDENRVRQHVREVLYAVENLAYHIPTTVDRLMQKNTAKLRKRYGGAFDAERSKNRDTEAEKEAMNDC